MGVVAMALVEGVDGKGARKHRDVPAQLARTV
jgi:hypothetical protein